MGLPPKHYADLSTETLQRFVVVTGASSNHFKESVDAIASVHANMPTRKIIYYDLGLKPDQIAQLKTWCNIEYRQFNTTRYPPGVKNLYNYAWKPLIVQDVLREHPTVLWVDSSFRCMSPNMTQLYQRARDSDGFVLFVPTGHSNFAVTHPGMFRYLPTDIEKQKRTEQFGATALFVVNTRTNFNEVLWWYYLCALTEDCIAPSKQRFCKFAADRFGTSANCHRFDQSLANVLLSTRWQYNTSRYALGASKLYVIERYFTSRFKVKTC